MKELLGAYPICFQLFTAGSRILFLFLLTPAVLGQTTGTAQSLRPDYWFVQTRDCPQVMGTDPGPYLESSWLDARGCLSRRDPADLWAMAAGRPVIFLVQGSYFTAEHAVTDGVRIRNDLLTQGAMPADAVVVAFHWPSELCFANPIKDANEKGRRAFVAGYHLARFLQGFPSGTRLSLIGHSHGGLAVLSALHLLGGGRLDEGNVSSCLPKGGPALRLRAVVIAAACDHQWLNPGERLDRALVASEGVLCLYNRLDPVLLAHPLGRLSDHQHALGRSGLSRLDEERLGPLAARFCQRSISLLIGVRHTFHGTIARPLATQWMRPYLWIAAGAVERPDQQLHSSGAGL